MTINLHVAHTQKFHLKFRYLFCIVDIPAQVEPQRLRTKLCRPVARKLPNLVGAKISALQIKINFCFLVVSHMLCILFIVRRKSQDSIVEIPRATRHDAFLLYWHA